MAAQNIHVEGVELQMTLRVVLVGASAAKTADRLAIALQNSDAEGKLAATLRDLAREPGLPSAAVVALSCYGEV